MDIRLHFQHEGKGVPLLLLHGNGESLAYFEHQTPFLRRHILFTQWIRGGHGGSPRGSAPFTFEQFAEDLSEWMEQNGIARAHLLGFSDGGNIALTFALRYPEKVAGLILNGANLCPGGMKLSIRLPIEWEYRMCRHDPSKRDKAELLALMARQPQIAPSALKRLMMPVLVVAGTNDMIRRKHTRQIAHSIPHAQLLLIRGDHFIAARQSEIFNQAVYAFLKQYEGETTCKN